MNLNKYKYTSTYKGNEIPVKCDDCIHINSNSWCHTVVELKESATEEN